MSDKTATPDFPAALQCPAPVVCPSCRGRLERQEERLCCLDCGQAFGYRNGFPDLIIGGRFDDATDEECLCYEERSNADLTEHYWLPHFNRLWPDRHRRPVRLLSVGCGSGVDVDMLADEGYDIFGIDNGNRTGVWPRRRHRERLLLANGKHLPFPDAAFDGVFCGCVFPHVGVIGDSSRVSPGHHDERLALAREMTRVLRPGGAAIVSSPNRLFPFDIFHGRRPGSFKPRLNWPGDPFLLSVGDYRRLFQEAGCKRATAMPVQGYWGFIRSRHSLKGLLLSLPVRLLFWLVSQPALSPLRNSPLSPWLVVRIEK